MRYCFVIDHVPVRHVEKYSTSIAQTFWLIQQMFEKHKIRFLKMKFNCKFQRTKKTGND
jgi:hypothetical protein